MSSSGQANAVVSSCLSFLDQLREVVGVRRRPQVRRLDRRPGEQLGCDRGEHLERHRVHAVAGVRGRGDDELAHHRRLADRQLQGDPAAHAVADDVRVVDPEVLEHRGGVVRHLLVGDRAIGVGRMPMSLLVDGDHLPRRGQARQDRTHRVDRHVGAVQQDERPAFPWIS